MFCGNCGNRLNDGDVYCNNCGTKKEEEKVVVPVQNNNNNKPRKRKSSLKPLLIVLIILGILGSGAFFAVKAVINIVDGAISSFDINDYINIGELLGDKNNTVGRGLDKLRSDYENNKITINEYFKELINLEYNNNSLNSKYKVDGVYYTDRQLGILDFIEKNKSRLNKDLLNEYFNYKFATNIHIGLKNTEVTPQKGANMDYQVNMLEGETSGIHFLDRVKMSSDENFLVWYTNDGVDAITDAQAEAILEHFEETVTKYWNLFGINYSYEPIRDYKFTGDYKRAQEVMNANHINVNRLEKAMSIYVYDLGGDAVLANYNDYSDLAKSLWFINDTFVLGEDGVINYPYVNVNKRGLTDMESLEQISSHELFHHFQYLYCKEKSGNRCAAPTSYTEATANFAASLVKEYQTTDAFLNGWVSAYKDTNNENIFGLKWGNDGYGAFPYLYSLWENVDRTVMLDALLEDNPYGYLGHNASDEELKKTINDLAFRTLAQNYTNAALKSDYELYLLDDISFITDRDFTIKKGAVNYFKLNKSSKIEVTLEGDKQTILVVGKLDNMYMLIDSSNDKLSLDMSYYSQYEDLYLVVTNASLIADQKYNIKKTQANFVSNKDFVTSYDNYKLKIDMRVKMAGVETSSISTGVMDEKHQKMYLSNTMSASGFSMSYTLYEDFDKGYTYFTKPLIKDVWYKEASIQQTFDINVLLEKLKKKKNVTDLGNGHYKVQLTSKELAAMNTQSDANVNFKGKIYIDVYTNNGYIDYIEYDLKKMILGAQEFNVKIYFADFNEAGDVEIPVAIVENAKKS